MSQVTLDLSGIASGQPGVPEPIATALGAMQTGHNDTDTKLTNVTSGHNHDGINSRLLTTAALSDFVPWTAWTPTLTNITKGSGTVTGRYMKIGTLVMYYLKIVLAADSSVASGPRFSLPVATSANFSGLIGHARLVDAGVATREGRASWVDVNTAEIYAFDSSATYLTATSVSATIPFVWGNTDTFVVHGSYEAAA